MQPWADVPDKYVERSDFSLKTYVEFVRAEFVRTEFVRTCNSISAMS